tara:strand:- start:62368 stop:63405 length:1038 start_codon:yes stop_codon:yes gene_type:complete
MAYNLPMDLKSLRYAVLGAGSFGTVLANIIAENGYQCSLWMRDESEAAETRATGINTRYLPNLQLPDNLHIDSRLHTLAGECDVFLFTVPSNAVRAVAEVVSAHIRPGAYLISGTKGIEPVSSKLMSQVLEEEIPGHEIAVLSGPNLAKEISERQLTGSVIASHSAELCALVQEVMGNSYFRIYSNDDRTGVELAGTLKNIYAILSGIASGLGFGANSMSMLITRSLAEMSRFASAQGANAVSYLGLSGVGDLIATCTSPLSRNYQIGLRVGQGMNLEQAVADLGQTAEGVNTVAVVHERAAQMNIPMPLCEGLYEILHANRPTKEVIASLMDRDQTQDVEYKVK